MTFCHLTSIFGNSGLVYPFPLLKVLTSWNSGAISFPMLFQEWFKSQKGLTQRAFGESVGVTQGRITQLLKGQNPSFALAHRISEVTRGAVTPNDFGKQSTPVASEAQEGS